jgi:transcription-repair coupling factor (superfamily II helicase)
VKVELPIDAHLPHDYIPGERLRLEAYRKLAACDTDPDVDAVQAELTDRYGTPPEPVLALFEVARFRVHARRAGLTEVALQGTQVRFGPVELPESRQLRLRRLYPGSLLKPTIRSILLPRPSTARVGGQPVRDLALLRWAREVIDAVVLEPAVAGATKEGRA